VATYRAWIVRGDAARGRAAAAHGRAAAAPGGASCESASCGAGTGVAMGTAPGGAPALVDADDPAAAVPAVVEGGDGVASAAAAVTAAFDDYRAAALDASEPREAWLLLEFCGGGTLDAALRSARFGVPGTPAAARAALVTLADSGPRHRPPVARGRHVRLCTDRSRAGDRGEAVPGARDW
jgi:hypothetical protein